MAGKSIGSKIFVAFVAMSLIIAAMGLALLIVVSGKGAPLAIVGDSFAGTATILAALGFVLVPFGLYLWTWRRAGAIADQDQLTRIS